MPSWPRQIGIQSSLNDRQSVSTSSLTSAEPLRRGLYATAGLVLLPALLVAGCSRVEPTSAGGSAVTVDAQSDSDGVYGTDVSDVIKRPALTLRDTSGRPFDLQARPRGEVTVLFFGYTNCDDVCPTTMADLAAARRLLHLRAADRSRLQVVFVTEDPARDAPGVLRTWLDRFDASFVGLIGGGSRTRGALDALKAPRTEVTSHAPKTRTGTPHPDGDGSHEVEHSGSVYAFDGDRTIVYTGDTTPKEYAADFTDLLRR